MLCFFIFIISFFAYAPTGHVHVRIVNGAKVQQKFRMEKFFAKKYEKICTIQKKAVPLQPLFKNERKLGPPTISDFWGEREHGEHSYERRGRESY